MKTTDFAIHMTRFFTRYLPNEKGSSPQTIESYRYAFFIYLEYMEEKCGIPPEKVTIQDFTRDSVLVVKRRNNGVREGSLTYKVD